MATTGRYLHGDVAKPKLKPVGAVAPNPAFQVKTGAEEKKKPVDKALVAGGVAGAAPFAGLIGQKKLIHDPLMGAKGQNYRTMEELSRAAMPGDVLVTTKPGGSIFKTTMAPLTGSEFYHAQPVFGRTSGRGGKMEGTTAGTASLADPKEFPGEPSLRRQTSRVARSMQAEDYPDVVLVRPKKPMSKQQLKEFNRRAMERSAKEYGSVQAVKNWARDIFVPKIKGITDRGPQVKCEGNICSTVPSMAMHEATGRSVVPGKRAQDVMPVDYLRSSEYELVGSRLKNRAKYEKVPLAMRKAMPYLSRTGLGLGLGATAYGATKDPDILGGTAGGVGATLAGSAAAKKMWGGEVAASKLPHIKNVLDATMTEGGTPFKTVAKRYATRRLPLIAGGAAAGYLGMKAIRKAVKKKISREPEEKVAFTVSEFSGDMNPGSMRYHSMIPPFRAPPLRKHGGPPPMEKEKKAATPMGMLTKAKKVGAPRASAPPGPSISQISKPIGFGTALPGTTKTAKVKEALIERLVRLGATPIKGTPKLLMKNRSPKELSDLQKAFDAAYDRRITSPLMGIAEKGISKLPSRVQPTVRKGAKLLAEDPIGMLVTSPIPIPGAQPAYLAGKKGLERLIDTFAPA